MVSRVKHDPSASCCGYGLGEPWAVHATVYWGGGGSAPSHRWQVPIKGDHAQTGSKHNQISLRWNVNVLCNVPNQRNRC